MKFRTSIIVKVSHILVPKTVLFGRQERQHHLSGNLISEKKKKNYYFFLEQCTETFMNNNLHVV